MTEEGLLNIPRGEEERNEVVVVSGGRRVDMEEEEEEEHEENSVWLNQRVAGFEVDDETLALDDA